jgi:hypothetical protein
LKEAADILAQSPCAMQLRYLQTLNGIATEQNSTIVFPLPVDLFPFFQKTQLDKNPFVFKPSTKTDHNNVTTTDRLISPSIATDI